MLARLSAKSAAPDYETLLVIPERPEAIAEAEEALRKTTAARQAGQQRHVEAGQRLAAQRLGQPIQITQAEVEQIGAELGPLFKAEAAAAAHRDEVLRAFEASVPQALAGPLSKYRDAIVEAMDEFEKLLGYGVAFKTKAAAAGLDLKRVSHLPGICQPMIERLDLVRKAFNHADRA